MEDSVTLLAFSVHVKFAQKELIQTQVQRIVNLVVLEVGQAVVLPHVLLAQLEGQPHSPARRNAKFVFLEVSPTKRVLHVVMNVAWALRHPYIVR